MEIIVAVLGIVALIIAALFYGAFSWGFVVSVFYGWFILPIYPNAPHLTIMQFVGIMLFLGAILPKLHVKDIKKEYRENEYDWIGSLAGPWITLICGWLIHLMY